MTRASRQSSIGADGKRQRQTRSTPKKRGGVCWGQPVLTTADHVDSEDECQDVERFDVLCGASLEDDPSALNPKLRESNRTKRLRATVHFNKMKPQLVPDGSGAAVREPEAPESSSKAAARKLKRAEAAAGKIRLSTAIPALVDITGEAASAVTASQPGTAPAAAVEALAALPEAQRQYMASQGFTEPTTVQLQVWEAAGRGVDVLAQAPPGSGKTLSYLLAIASTLLESGHGHNTRPTSPLALIVAPTHELAQQIQRAAAPLQQLSGVRCTCVHGGSNRDQQVLQLRKQPHLLVATPGRLLDLVDTQELSLAQVAVVALDECDKMLSMGFATELSRLRCLLLEPRASGNAIGSVAAGGERDCEKGLAAGQEHERHADEAACDAAENKKSKKQRRKLKGDVALVPCAPPTAFKPPQVLLVSATMPPAALEVAEGWLSPDAAHMHVMHGDSDLISSTIIQHGPTSPPTAAIRAPSIRPTVCGLNTTSASRRRLPCKPTVNGLAAALTAAHFKCASLHGKKTQPERTAALQAFRCGKVQVLVATDVAARGLHIPRLPYIVNYDFPSNLETYVHRVGRTGFINWEGEPDSEQSAGRLEAHGHTFSFMTRNLAPLAPDLVDLLTKCGQAVDPNLVKLQDAYRTIQSKVQGGDLPASKPSAPCEPGSDGGGGEDERRVSVQTCGDASGQTCGAAASKRGVKRGKDVTGNRVRCHDSAARESKQGRKHEGAQGQVQSKVEDAHERLHVECDLDTGADIRAPPGKKSQRCLSTALQNSAVTEGAQLQKKKKRRRCDDNKPTAGTGRKRVKQGILGPSEADRLASLAYSSGQDSD